MAYVTCSAANEGYEPSNAPLLWTPDLGFLHELWPNLPLQSLIALEYRPHMKPVYGVLTMAQRTFSDHA